MDIQKLVEQLRGCKCGREHTVDIRAREIGSNMTRRAGEILRREGFPQTKLLLGKVSQQDLLMDGLVRGREGERLAQAAEKPGPGGLRKLWALSHHAGCLQSRHLPCC